MTSTTTVSTTLITSRLSETTDSETGPNKCRVSTLTGSLTAIPRAATQKSPALAECLARLSAASSSAASL